MTVAAVRWQVVMVVDRKRHGLGVAKKIISKWKKREGKKTYLHIQWKTCHEQGRVQNDDTSYKENRIHKVTWFFELCFLFAKFSCTCTRTRHCQQPPNETRQVSNLPPPHFVYIQQDTNANGLQDRERKRHRWGEKRHKLERWKMFSSFVVFFFFVSFYLMIIYIQAACFTTPPRGEKAQETTHVYDVMGYLLYVFLSHLLHFR